MRGRLNFGAAVAVFLPLALNPHKSVFLCMSLVPHESPEPRVSAYEQVSLCVGPLKGTFLLTWKHRICADFHTDFMSTPFPGTETLGWKPDWVWGQCFSLLPSYQS